MGSVSESAGLGRASIALSRGMPGACVGYLRLVQEYVHLATAGMVLWHPANQLNVCR